MKKIIATSTIFYSLLFLLASCQKHSVFTGRVTNSADNSPVEGASVSLFYNRDNKGTLETVTMDQASTSSNGEYSVEVESKAADVCVLKIEKQGFAPTSPLTFHPGDCGEQDFVLNPYDAWLSVTVENTSASTKQFYYNYTGPFLANMPYCFAGCGPFIIQPNDNMVEVELIPGGSEITISWDTTSSHIVIYKETIFCNRGDTTFVHIKI